MDCEIWEKEGRNKRRTEGKVEKWASFTRPRRVPKAGRGMEGWVKRQQVRQTHKYMKKKQHTHWRGNSPQPLSKVPSSAKRKPPCTTLGVMLSNIYQLSIRFLGIAAREERAWNKAESGGDLCVCEVKYRGACEVLMPGFHTARNQQNKLPKSIMAAPAWVTPGRMGRALVWLSWKIAVIVSLMPPDRWLTQPG